MVTSSTFGDPSRFRSFEDLRQALASLAPAPLRTGRLSIAVARREGGLREILPRTILSPESGISGDAWLTRVDRNPDAEIAVIQRDIAELLANGQPLTLSGDNLFLDLDLSSANMPIGTRVRIGSALLAVTPKPHNGCHKFEKRFGPGALRLVSDPALRPRNLRGIYLRTLAAGEIAQGDPVQVLL